MKIARIYKGSKSKLAAACVLATALSGQAFAADEAPQGLAYKGISLQLGGFLASDVGYRTNNVGADVSTPYTSIPFQNAAGYGIAEFRESERQSRFSILALGDVSPGVHMAGFYEFDMLGTAPGGNPKQSNSFTPRTRNVYMTIDWDEMGLHFLGGQSWSLLTPNGKGMLPRTEWAAATIDGQPTVGYHWARQSQVRIVKDWDKKLWLGLSLEGAQTLTVAGNGTANNSNTVGANSQMSSGTGSTVSMNSYPDVIAKFAFESEWGHFEVYDVMRNFKSRFGGGTLATQTNVQDMWTNAYGFGLLVPFAAKSVELSLSGMMGKGVARYGSSQLNDATIAEDNSLNPLNGSQYLAQVLWHASPTWDTYVGYGQESVEGSVAANGNGYGDRAVGDNSGCSTLGGGCTPHFKSVSQGYAGFWWSFYKGTFGAARFGAQYGHVNLATFADASANAFAPTTTDDVFFTSVRYFPF